MACRLYSRETRCGRITQYHGHIITPDGVKLTIGQAERLLNRYLTVINEHTFITEGELIGFAQPGVYIGSGAHNRKLADLVATGYGLLAINVEDNDDVFLVK